MVTPAFISFEGLDGCGKTTQAELLAAHLRQAGERVLLTREPGGTPLGERIRALVLGEGERPAPEAELALMCASRAQSVRELIRPALAGGAWVLCDRFHDATEAYQGGGRGMDGDVIRALHRLLCGDLQPALTLILELEPRASLARARRLPTAGRFERESDAFFERVAAAYHRIAQREPQRCLLLPASGTPAEVAQRVRDALALRLGLGAPERA
ncbi:MAG TPA: dTMP kinase [Terriglobales bacterium]|nr:dTMP kinase [Terriglobales bacterium]